MRRRALAVQAELVDDFPAITPFALTTAFYDSALARMLQRREELDEARQLLESATKRLEALLERRRTGHPRVPHLGKCERPFASRIRAG